MDSGMLLRLVPMAVTLAGWVLFVVLAYKVREHDGSRPCYHAGEDVQGSTFSTDCDPPTRTTKTKRMEK